MITMKATPLQKMFDSQLFSGQHISMTHVYIDAGITAPRLVFKPDSHGIHSRSWSGLFSATTVVDHSTLKTQTCKSSVFS